MQNQKIIPCLWFDGAAEDAARFYTETLPGGGEITAISRYPESGENPPGAKPGSVLTVEFEAGGYSFSALNGGPTFKPNPSISFFIQVETAKEVDRLYELFAEGGTTLMPLDGYDWSERYAWVQDRFGISWQLTVAPPEPAAPAVIPNLLFAGSQQGKAEEAMKFYTELFPRGEVKLAERYPEGQPKAGQLMFGGFSLDGHPMAAMDSGVDQDLSFNEGISLQLMCEDQAEIDRYWSSLSSGGGETGVCGWLKDRFGVSWQVVPVQIREWFKHPDAAARDRAFRAMMEMKKFDISSMEAALRGG